MKEMTVSDGYWEYHDCGADMCKGSEGGHDWDDLDHDGVQHDYFQERCQNCDGTRKEWWEHRHATYRDSGGWKFHRHDAGMILKFINRSLECVCYAE